MTKRLLYVFSLPIAIAGLYSYFTYGKQQFPRLLDADTLAKTTDSSVFDVQYRQYNTSGVAIHFLEAPLIRHIPKDDTHLLSTPHIIVIEPNKKPWEINADYATATQGGQQINFNQHVRIHQQQQNSDAETLLSTEDLTYFPKQKKASTLAEVTLTQDGNQMRSKGLIADLATNTVRLLSNARGHYVHKDN